MAKFNITADSVPVYDGFGFENYWGGDEWVTWHKALVRKQGNDKANDIWSSAWLDGVSVISGGKGVAKGSNYFIDSVPLEARTLNDNFRSYIKLNKFLYNTVYSGIGGMIAKPLGAGVDVVSSASTIVSDAASGIENGLGRTIKTLGYILPVLVVGIGVLLLYKGYKSMPSLKAL